MELYRVERDILACFPPSQESSAKRQIAFSFMKETRSWVDLENYEKAKQSLQSAGEILESQVPGEAGEWRGLSGLLGGGLNKLPDYTLKRAQSQLLETERRVLQGKRSLCLGEFEDVEEHFMAAQTVADRLAENSPEAPEFLHYSAQVKLRIADEFAAIPNHESDIVQLRNLATEALSSLKEMDSDNPIWNQTLQYTSVD